MTAGAVETPPPPQQPGPTGQCGLSGQPIGPTLAERISCRSAALAKQMVARLSQQVEFYAHLPKEQLDGDILSVCRHNIEVFLRIFEDRSTPAPEELEVIRSSAASRADEGMPLDALLRAYYVGFSLMWDQFQREAADDEREQLLPVATAAMAYIAEVTSVITQAYIEEYEIIASTRRDVRRSLVEALLTGRPAEDLAAQAGVHLHPGYSVVALAFGPSDDEGRPEVERRVAARRKVRRVISYLEGEVGPDCLTVLDESGGTVLLPDGEEGTGNRRPDVPVLVQRLTEVARCPVTAGFAWSDRVDRLDRLDRLERLDRVDRVAAGSAEAKSILHLAQALGLPPGAYRRQDLLFEYAVSRDPSSMSGLAALLEPLARGRTDLVETVEVYFACDLERRQAAATLHVHPNTLDYRLRRVRALTGVDVSSLAGASVLRAALVARHLTTDTPFTGSRSARS